MSSTLAKNLEHELVVILKDARVDVLNRKGSFTEKEYLDMINTFAREIKNAKDKREKNDLTRRLIANAIHYQIKFL